MEKAKDLVNENRKLAKMKQCNKCKKWKEESEFSKNLIFKDGLRYWCKTCESKYQRRYYLRTSKVKRRNLRYEQCHRVINGVKEKRCRRCRKWKNESSFYKDSQNKDGLGGVCKECSSKDYKRRSAKPT